MNLHDYHSIVSCYNDLFNVRDYFLIRLRHDKKRGVWYFSTDYNVPPDTCKAMKEKYKVDYHSDVATAWCPRNYSFREVYKSIPPIMMKSISDRHDLE